MIRKHVAPTGAFWLLVNTAIDMSLLRSLADVSLLTPDI